MHNYFQAYSDYFWQWEENGTLLAIPRSHTIAYQQLVEELLHSVSGQGLPPFGTLLMAIIATNPQPEEDISQIQRILTRIHPSYTDEIKDAMDFLRTLASVPSTYKTSKKRILLFQTIFQNCHHIQRINNSLVAATGFSALTPADKIDTKATTLKQVQFDVRPLAILAKKYQTAERILKKMSNLPDLKDEISVDLSDPTPTGDAFSNYLMAHTNSFYVGALLRHIWAGLAIPMHHMLPSEQPVGGFSDVTNKSSFDRLLISEFANDDLMFLSRIANNEALFIQREVPLQDNRMQRYLLIDTSIWNWGTPKTVAFAIAVALAHHPKTAIPCSAFLINSQSIPFDITSRDGIIEGLLHLETVLHPGQGLQRFFQEHKPDPACEVFLLCHKDVMEQSGFLQIFHQYQKQIRYLIHTDSSGGIDVFRQSGSKHLIQHLQLPLTELWSEKNKKTPEIQAIGTEYASSYPLLATFDNNRNRMILITETRDYYCITSKGALLTSSSNLPRKLIKGWEVVSEQINRNANQHQLLTTSSGARFMLSLILNNLSLELLDLQSGQLQVISFPQLKTNRRGKLASVGDAFYFVHNNNYLAWRIDTNGTITKTETNEQNLDFISNQIIENKSFGTNSGTAFYQLHNVSINRFGQLCFNQSQILHLANTYIRIGSFPATEHVCVAVAEKDGKHLFADGSTVSISNSAMITLTSSNPSLEPLYLPATLDADIAIASNSIFSGNSFFRREMSQRIVIESPGNDLDRLLSIISQYCQFDYDELKQKLQQGEPVYLRAIPISDAYDELLSFLEKNQTKYTEFTVKHPLAGTQEIIPPSECFKSVIAPFIQHIMDHGADSQTN